MHRDEKASSELMEKIVTVLHSAPESVGEDEDAYDEQVVSSLVNALTSQPTK